MALYPSCAAAEAGVNGDPDDPEEEILLDASAAKNPAYGFAEEIIKHKY